MVKEVQHLDKLGFRLSDTEYGGIVVQYKIYSSLVAEVKEKQFDDPYLLQVKDMIHKHKIMGFVQGGDDGTLRYQDGLCIPDIDWLRKRIMSEAQNSRYSIYSGSTKMYHGLKEIYM
ncbi:uncharacterized protein [Nicotiana tomentosiformis]|uniref:uncharacterized protein n=1 Tax=Nicotiana tomentosiformis TaxID=4098 RepID=UPI00388C4861